MGNSSSRRQRIEASADPGGTQHQTDEEKEEGTLSSETVLEEASADPGGTQHQMDEEKEEGTLSSETVLEDPLRLPEDLILSDEDPPRLPEEAQERFKELERNEKR